ncbi:hypothetical protein E8E11_010439 [Didymella keratinophila]|nr:hypothetical protein E8E11_010439 [Didymella keratinophila]
MTPDRVTSLEKVREALNKADSQHAPLFISLTKNGKNRPFDGKPSSRLSFGPEQNDFPSLGRKQSPFASKALPSLEDLQQLLIADLRTSQHRHKEESNDGTQPGTNESQTDTDQLEQLESLTDDQPDTGGIVLSFRSPVLDDMCGDKKVAYDNVVSESMTEATVLPRDTLLSLQHSNEGTTFTTLLSGSVAWIIWPPTKHNLDILQSSYSAFAEGFDGTKMNVSSELRDGVCLVQTAGDAIRLPPFCPMLCLSIKSSILATYFVLTGTQLVDVLHKIPLLLEWWKTEIDGERKKNKFMAALLDGISTVLQGKYEPGNLRDYEYPYAQEGPLLTLLQSWNEVKHAVAGVLEPAETERMMAMWTDFLSNAKGRKCWICGKAVSNKLKDMPKHFGMTHWVAQDAAEGVPQLEKTSSGFKKAPTLQDVAGGEEGDSSKPPDAMEVLELRPDMSRETVEEVTTSASGQERTAEPQASDEGQVVRRSETPVFFC